MSVRSQAPSEPASKSNLTPSFVVGLVIVGFWLLVALFGPALAPHLESDIVTDMSYAPAGEVGLLGSDYLGRDVFSRLLYGARMTMGLALLAALLSFSLGVILGFTAAISGRWICLLYTSPSPRDS